jgi:hypothetical protein
MMHLTPRRVAGYLLPVGSYLTARLLHDPNANDHRLVAWLIPVGCFAGALLLLADLKKPPGERSVFAILAGAVALLVGLFFIAVFTVFNGMMHR